MRFTSSKRFSNAAVVLACAWMLQACDNGPAPENANETCVAPAQLVQDDLSTQLVAAFPQLPVLSSLVGLLQAPGNDRWYAITQEGRIYWFTNSSSANQLNLLIDLRSVVRNSGEMGLLGMAFHPNFISNNEVYVSYSDSRHEGRSTFSRFIANGTNEINISTEQVILTVEQPAANHNGGQIVFGQDGMLYIGLGDGGGAGDTYGNGQNMEALLGKLLRIDVTNTATYTIPADNPFVGIPNVRPEIYASGLRNPWRFSFDKQTGELWLADVGQNVLEEVNLIIKGGNYGWPIMEGTSCFQTTPCNQTGLQLPVAEYSHQGGDCSVSGGFVYRGTESAALAGRYLYGDFCTGRLRSTVANELQQYVTQELLLTGMNIPGFAQDTQGEVYALNYSGGAGEGIYRLTATSGGTSSTIPEKLSETGCFADTAQKTVVEGVLPYNVTTALWSDGADKTRFLAVPTTQKVQVLSDGDFDFPVGSVLIKNFLHDDQYLETRLFMRHQNGWGGYSYEWLPDQSDALLVEDGKTLNAGDFFHIIPSPGQCFECHTSAAHLSLGVEASQLNFDYTYPTGKSGNQNTALYKAGYLQSQPTANQITPLAAIDNTSASIDLRARSYLHANCSGCHRPGGPASQMDFRIQTAFSSTGSCNVEPSAGALGIENARLIAPGDPSRSIVLQRMLALDENRMPPLASLSVDASATDVIAQWISEMVACP